MSKEPHPTERRGEAKGDSQAELAAAPFGEAILAPGMHTPWDEAERRKNLAEDNAAQAERLRRLNTGQPIGRHPLHQLATAGDENVDLDVAEVGDAAFARPFGSEPREFDEKTGRVRTFAEGQLARGQAADAEADAKAAKSSKAREKEPA